MDNRILSLLGKTLVATATMPSGPCPGALLVNLSKNDGNSYRLGLPVMVRADKPTKGIGSTGEYGGNLPTVYRAATLVETIAFFDTMTEKGLQRIENVFAD